MMWGHIYGVAVCSLSRPCPHGIEAWGKQQPWWYIEGAQHVSVECLNDFSLGSRTSRDLGSLIDTPTVLIKPQLIWTDGQIDSETQSAT